MTIMNERRIEPRMLCAELIEIRWCDKDGSPCTGMANLEDISLSGACLHMERPIPRGATVKILYGDGELVGAVQYYLYRDWGYFLGVEFSDGCKWSSHHFKPQHLLDPRILVERAAHKHLSHS